MDSTKEKGMSFFLDVFRRADKNDDSALSWDEFRTFFADGVMSEDEIRNLFHEIDTHNTNNIDTEELCTYFSQHLGAFKDIFCALEDLNLAVSSALGASAQDYPKASSIEQFTTRFLLREITNQLTALQRPLDSAADALDEKALEISTDTENVQMQSAAALLESGSTKQPVDVDADMCHQVTTATITPGRVARRAKKQFSTQTSWSTEAGTSARAMNQQVERLRSLVDRLENKVNFSSIPEEEVIETDKDDLIVVNNRRMRVEEGHEKAFKNSLRNYVEAAGKVEQCLSVSVRSYAGSPLICVYEVWKSPEDWQMFTATSESKLFSHSNIDHLATPEQLSSVRLPGSWWSSE